MKRVIYPSLILLLFGFQTLGQTSTSWTGAISTSWFSASNWTNGVPNAITDAIIGDASFTGTFQPVISLNGAYCKSVQIGEAVPATLTLTNNRSMTFNGDVIIHPNGALSHQQFYLYVKGHFINDGSYTTTTTTSITELNGGGAEQIIGGSTSTAFRRLIIGAASLVKLENNIQVANIGSYLGVYGTIDPGTAPGFKITSRSINRIFSGGKLLVHASTFNANYDFNSNVLFQPGSNVEYDASSNQTITNAYSYATLTISGSGVKTLQGNLPALVSTAANGGNIFVNSGTLNLGTFTANRGSSVAGGKLQIADGATLQLGAASYFPTNFQTVAFHANSNALYDGTTQNLSPQIYGHLVLSGGAKSTTGAITALGSLSVLSGSLNASHVLSVGDLSIAAGSTLENTGTIKIAGTATNNGMFDATLGTVEFNGSTAQSISSGLFMNNTVQHLVISNNVSLDDADTITGSLTVNAGNTFTTNDQLVLKSTASGTAYINELPVDGAGNATAFIQGKVAIERYIPARKAWRLLSIPVRSTSAPTISEAWQEGVTGTSMTQNPNPGYGVHITGGSSANGFDQSSTNAASIKYLNTAINNFSALPATPGTLRPITDFAGYMVYIRGDRGINLMLGAAAPTTSTTLRIKGEVKTGNQQTAVNASGFTVLGNPYPSAIDFATLTRNNVKNSFYIWDPQLGGTYGLGGYVTVSYNSGTGTYDVTTAASPISQYIPSGEAILVESLDGATPGTITVKESDKTTNGSDMLFRTTGQAGSSLRMTLLADNPQAESDLIDGTLISFHEKFNNGLDQEDVSKMKGSAESISIACKGKELAIERRLGVSSTDTTFIQIDQLKKQANYVIAFEASALPEQIMSASIIDLYQKESKPTALNLSGTTRLAFSTTQHPASVAPNRFVIVYTVKPATASATASIEKARPVATIETAAVSVYPNPVTGNQVQLNMQNMKAGMYTVVVYSLTGQRLAQQTIQYNNLGTPVRFMLPEGITAGQYELQVIGNGKTNTTSLIKQ